MPLNKLIRSRIIDALTGTPTVVTTLLTNVPAESPVWEYRASPERFSLREIMAHLADYDTMWLEYLTAAMSSPDGPAEVTPYTPDDRAAAGDYAHSVPAESLATFAANRPKLVALLPELESDEWETKAMHSSRHGILTVEGMATLYLAHDGYHTRQIAEYVTANR